MSGNTLPTPTPSPIQNSGSGQPPEGPKTLPINVPFTSQVTTWNLPVFPLISSGQMSALVSCLVNNTGNSQSVTVTVTVSNNSQVIAAGAAEWITLLSPSNATIIFTSTGGVTVPVQITNFFVQPTSAGGGGSSGGTYAGGALLVTDQALDATITNNRVRTLNNNNGSGDVATPNFAGTVSWIGTINSGQYDVGLVTAAPFLCITGLIISVSDDFTVQTPGPCVVVIWDTGSGGPYELIRVAMRGTTAISQNLVCALSGLQLLNVASGGGIYAYILDSSNSGLRINTGHLFVTMFGAITAT